MANLLLWYGADPLLKNDMGSCALDKASNPAMKKLLKCYLAKSRGHSVAGRKELFWHSITAKWRNLAHLLNISLITAYTSMAFTV